MTLQGAPEEMVVRGFGVRQESPVGELLTRIICPNEK